MTAPSGSGWQLLGTRGSQSAGSYVHVWWKAAASNDPASWTFNDHSTSNDACDLAGSIVALYDWDPSDPLVLAWRENPAGTVFTAPGATGVVDGLLVSGYHRGDDVGSSVTFSNPGAQTIRSQIGPSGSWVSLCVATEPLTAAGATGTRTVTSSDSAPSIAWSLVVGPSAVAAAGTMGSTGTLSAAQLVLDVETVALSGRGTLTAGAARAVTPQLSGSGALSAGTPLPKAIQAVALSGAGALVAGARMAASAALSGLGTLTGLRGRMMRQTGSGVLVGTITFRFAPLTWPVDGAFDSDGVTTGTFTTDGISAGAFDSDGIGDGHFAY
jgi:hypothetical protein